ncbi:spore germination protein [Clostridium sp. P21]|uniref:Spore germination protein n=1 Tax=Clostridium muellerianum TaxID=2716538 RepID=A0A7Y0EHZ6_9CLOT|nr:spore germination protein [Clostridium muellerianum]NMM63741.1 spore germination protein [Clostridium muellerianum]
MKFFKSESTNKINEDNSSIVISKDINENISRIKVDFGGSSDFKIDYFKFDNNADFICATICIKSLTDKVIMNSLSLELSKLKLKYLNSKFNIEFDTLINYFSGIRDLEEDNDYETLYIELLLGNTVFLVDGYDKFFSIRTNTDEGRAVQEPTSQTIIRGPKDSFTEKLSANILLIRKRIKNKKLKMENLFLGSVTKTAVSVMYIDEIAKDDIVQEIKNRLNKIEIDAVLESGYIEELIKDDKYSIFPTFLNSEKPDSVAAALLEGKVAILVEGTPYVLTAPAIMFEFFQSSEDYYHHYIISSMMRFIRFIAFLLTLLTPATYIAITTFHQEMLPTPLLISIAAQREGVPFPVFIETLSMEFVFEIIREAGIRMPRAVGSAISIVGALVLGQAAVEAGIISASIVIVVSITAISSFAIPNYEMSNAIRAIRFILMFLSALLGLYGVFIGLIILVLHLCKIKSITVPYLTPIAPRVKNSNKDTFFRFPLWKMKHRLTCISATSALRVREKDPVSSSQKKKPELR